MNANSDNVQMGSSRSFGLVFFLFFLILSIYPLLKSDEPNYIFLSISAVFLILSLLYPKVLSPLNYLWFKFGLLLHAITNPLILGVIFFLVIFPISLVMRAFKKDSLRLKASGKEHTFWVERSPPGPSSESMKNQF